jgi:hypothetical protein
MADANAPGGQPPPANPQETTVAVGTTLLGGVAWSGDVYTAGQDGSVYRFDPTNPTAPPVPTPMPGAASRARVLLGRGGQLLTCHTDGRAYLWSDGSKPSSSAPVPGTPSASPAAYGERSAVVGIDSNFYTWDDEQGALDDHTAGSTTPPSVPESGGRIDVLTRTVNNSPTTRGGWSICSKNSVLLFGLDRGHELEDRGTLPTPAPVLLAVPFPSDPQDSFVVVGTDGVFRRYEFPEDALIGGSDPGFGQAAPVGFTRTPTGGWLVAVGGDRKANVLEVKAPGPLGSPTVSAAALDGTDPVAAVAAPGGRPVVALLTKTDNSSRVMRLTSPTAAQWDSVATTLTAAVAGSLAVADSGKRAVVVAKTSLTPGPVLQLMALDAAPPTIQAVKASSDTGGTVPFTYDATQHVAFLPGRDDALLLLTVDGDGMRSLRAVSVVVTGNAATASTVAVYKGTTATGQLAAAPAVVSDGATGYWVASAWAKDGNTPPKIRVHHLPDLTHNAPPGSEADSPGPGDVLAVALSRGATATNPPRLAVLVKGQGRRDGKLVVSVRGTDAALTELESFTTAGGALSVGPPPFGWCGDSGVVGTADTQSNLQLEAFLPALDRFPGAAPATTFSTAAALVANGKPRRAALVDATNKPALFDLSAWPPKAITGFTTALSVAAVEWLSDNDFALVPTGKDQVAVIHWDGNLTTPKFTSLAWSPAGGAKVASVRRVNDTNLLATLDSGGGDRVLLTLPPDPSATGAALTPGDVRHVRARGAPAVVGPSTAPVTIGFEQLDPSNSVLSLVARAALTDAAAPQSQPVTSVTGAAGSSPAITAAAWDGDSSPIFGLADGRLWARPDPSHDYGPFTPATTTGQMVQALAIDGDGGLFAFALTLEGGRVHVRRAGSPAADLGDPNHPLDAGAPATALLFFSLSGSRVLAAGTTGGKVRLWQLHDNGGTSGDPRDLNFSGAEVQSLAFRPLKAQGVVRLAGLSRLGDITVWTGDASADVGAFPQDGTALKVTAWESNSAGQPLGARASLVWKPDATQLAVASQDGNVFLVPVTDQTSAPPA